MISLIIPTINRSDHIIRYLRYLTDVNFTGQILIGDSSNEYHHNIIKKFVKKKFKFQIILKKFPKKLPHYCIFNLKRYINQKYAMFICDDDIIIYENIKFMTQFLNQNKNYSSVGGKMLLVGIDKNNKPYTASPYPLNNYEKNKSVDRVIDMFNNYTVVNYTIKRAEIFKKTFKIKNNNFDKGLSAEVHPSFLCTTFGKVKSLNKLFCIRFIHHRRIILKEIQDLVFDFKWQADHKFFFEDLLKEIIKIDKKISKNKLEKIIRAYKNYNLTTLRLNPKKKSSSILKFFKFSRRFEIFNSFYFKIKINNLLDEKEKKQFKQISKFL